VVFGGFSGESLSGRLNDMQCDFLITQDEGWRRGNRVPLKVNADAALESSPTVKTCIVARRTGGNVNMMEGRDVWANDMVEGVSDDPASCPCEPMDSEDRLYLLYTSGMTAKPKGIIHTICRPPGRRVDDPPLHLDAGQTRFLRAADIGWSRATATYLFGPPPTAPPGSSTGTPPDFGQGPLVEDRRATGPTSHTDRRRSGTYEVGRRRSQHDLSSLGC
jgi:acetyl-CoA synthetase